MAIDGHPAPCVKPFKNHQRLRSNTESNPGISKFEYNISIQDKNNLPQGHSIPLFLHC